MLRGRGIEVLSIPDDLSLGDSIAYALSVLGAVGPIRILHGDTMFLDTIPNELDIASVTAAALSYSWGLVDGAGRFVEENPAGLPGGPVLTGYFAFSSGSDLRRALTIARGNFIEALNIYSSSSTRLRLCELGDWIDCGHLQTYYHSRAKVTTARAFNSLKINRRIVEKSSRNELKVRMEANWFEQLPPIMRLYAPQYLGSDTSASGTFSYRVAYEYSPTLHELYVFGRLGQRMWQQILGSGIDFLQRCVRMEAPAETCSAIDHLVLQKTPERLAAYARATGLDLDEGWTYAGRPLPGLSRIAEMAASLIQPSSPETTGLMHGDFCFPNIFYDFRQESIKVIDPRGSFVENEPSVYGDVRYDLAKLNHSLEGYDFILANRYVLDVQGERAITISFPDEGSARWVGRAASEFQVAGRRITDPEIRALTIHLFLSMLPLHADKPNRQRAFLANALRLFVGLDV
ncbi:Phosphotransferase enzyme family protein [Methylobacterium sp. 174MFSha1.1]|nr:Phosphotransferase enzyme family protein [Methylobacterium sp. 174MFSha1.1]